MKSRVHAARAGAIKSRALPTVAFLALLAIPLSGCAPEPVVPSTSPSPGVSSSPSPTPSETPDAASLVIPDTCDGLVSLDVVQAQFSSGFDPLPSSLTDSDPVAHDFAARGGLMCVWGIPNSDAGFLSVYVAARGPATDALQVTQWQAAGFSECPPFLDECYYEHTVDEIGEFWTVHILVEGFELRVQATATSLDPMLNIARAASTSMGYV
ncbi:hypothetical protein GCM10022239_16940 [Leifsonia bigeumensis]|uniref:DUF3558 domain-containing protein n=1 Tax=Leifsonella bigeumensis TaxID=433643 RepID=A0ABP7FKA5_9MICO